MGWIYRQTLEKAGGYLLGILARKGTVPYSRFYSTTSDPAELARESGLPEDDAHVFIEFAAQQLEHAGLVSFAPLEGHLFDSDQDYSITLTPAGRDFLQAGSQFRYRTQYL